MVIKLDKNIKYFKIKIPLESIGASFLKISLIEPKIFKVDEWFQVKFPAPFRLRSSLIGVYVAMTTRGCLACETSIRIYLCHGFEMKSVC